MFITYDILCTLQRALKEINGQINVINENRTQKKESEIK